MDTLAYLSRAWWIMRSFSYSEPVAQVEENLGDGTPAPLWYRGSPFETDNQASIWNREARACAAAAVAPTGDPRLVRKYVDRQGNLLPEHA